VRPAQAFRSARQLFEARSSTEHAHGRAPSKLDEERLATGPRMTASIGFESDTL
jgi:hypothetical protein